MINPATEEVIAKVAGGGAEDIVCAVNAARSAFDDGPWSAMSGTERADVLRTMAANIRRRTDELARIEVLDNGKPLSEAKWDIEDVAGCFEFYAGLAEQRDNEPPTSVDLPDQRFQSRVVTEPVGVVGAIVPWNFPMLMAAWKVAPALAAGCTVVLKTFRTLSAFCFGARSNRRGVSAATRCVECCNGDRSGCR